MFFWGFLGGIEEHLEKVCFLGFFGDPTGLFGWVFVGFGGVLAIFLGVHLGQRFLALKML